MKNTLGEWQAVISVGILALTMTGFLVFDLVHELTQIQGY